MYILVPSRPRRFRMHVTCQAWRENSIIRMNVTRLYEPARLSILPTQTLAFTKTAGRHNLVEFIVI